MKLSICFALILLLAGCLSPVDVSTPEGVAASGGIRSDFVQGPTVSEVTGDASVSYVLRGYYEDGAERFQLVAILGRAARGVSSATIAGQPDLLEFSVPEGDGNVRMTFGSETYRHGLRNGLEVNLGGDTAVDFVVSPTYMQGFDILWRRQSE